MQAQLGSHRPNVPHARRMGVGQGRGATSTPLARRCEARRRWRTGVPAAASPDASAVPAAAPAAEAGAPAAAAKPLTAAEEEARFHEAYSKAYTVSQLYNLNRPPPVPLTEYEARRRRRDMEDILAAAKKAGKSQDAVRAGIEQLETLLPDLVNLNKMRASEWVKLASDVNGVASKIILLKTLYPKADAFSMLAARPKTLLLPEATLSENAGEVKRMLANAANVDAIVEAVPELIDASQLSRSLAWLRGAFPGHDPVELLQENPLILKNIGESNVEDSAEYGEMTTKD